jgi:hypothetical protein
MTHQHLSNIICHIILYNNKTLKWFISLIWYPFKILFSPLYYTQWDKQNQISFAYVFLKNKLTHPCFKSQSSICTTYRPCVFFSFFRAVRFELAQLVSSPPFSPPRCYLFSGWRRHTAAPYHTSFPFSQDELVASASSSDNASSRRLPSRAETEALNPHHRHRLPTWTARLLSSTVIKRLSQHWSLYSSLNRVSILPPP